MNNNYNKSEKLAKIIRVTTVAPFNIFIAMTLIFLIKPNFIGGILPYILSVLFLAIFPLLAYPCQKFVPYYRDKGRNGQRNFSIVMSVIGYLLGLTFSLIFKENNFIIVLYLTYLLSGISIAVFSKIIKFKASGHTCGLIGPLALLFYVFNFYALIGLIIVPFVFWASIKLKRHTFPQLIAGSFIPIVIFTLLINFL